MTVGQWISCAMKGSFASGLVSCVLLAGCSPGAGDERAEGESAATVPETAPTTEPADPVSTLTADEVVARNSYGVGLMGRFEYDAARAVFEELNAARPDWLDIKVNLAIATFNRQEDGDEEHGLALLAEVLEEDPRHLRAHFCSGLLKMRKGEQTAAHQHFNKVANGDPDDPYAAYNLAQCQEEQWPESALRNYRKAIDLDPYLRSAYYRAFQLLQRQGRPKEAETYFDDFQRLETNPRARLVEVKYTRMGPKAEVIAISLDDGPTPPPEAPSGDPFAAPVPLIAGATNLPWSPREDRPSMTGVDIDDDGDVDAFIAAGLSGPNGPVNVVALHDGAGRFTVAADHPLSAVTNVRAALWGDFDNDGQVDVYLCRNGENRLMQQAPAGVWRDVTDSTGTGAGSFDTVDGAIFDADHDGDLDLFCVNADGPNELLMNNLDGTFRPVAEAQGLTGARASRQVVVVDLDRDRDLDIIVINDAPPNEVYLNDRLWQYDPDAEGWDSLRRERYLAAVAADRDADGEVEINALRADGFVDLLTVRRAPRRWKGLETLAFDEVPTAISLMDVAGNGNQRIIVSSSSGWRVTPFGDRQPLFLGPQPVPDATEGPAATAALAGLAPLVVEPRRGPALVAVRDRAEPLLWPAGPGRYEFAALTFSGREDLADSMRSNASGIGTEVAARVETRWVTARTPAEHSSSGQSLQPITIGLGGAPKIDFVSIDWSDGVFQSEINLEAGGPHRITETQRQLSSCPVLFAWNGERFEFVTDILGVGGMGYLLAPGTYATPRPRERLLLPDDALVPRDGRYQLKITEPMEEACYLDAAALHAYDLPPGWAMTLDERMRVNDPTPTGAPRFVRTQVAPIRATNDRGDDVLDTIVHADGVAAPVGALDHRFIGRLERDHVLTIAFAAPLDASAAGGVGEAGGAPILIIDGWVEYPYSQTMFSAWQASAAWRAPTVEARGADGAWTVVLDQFGYPAGMPRQMSVPLDGLPSGTRELRLSTNQQIYWDRIEVGFAERCADVRQHMIEPAAARLDAPGFPKRTTLDQYRPMYDWDRRVPLWDTKRLRGFYTELGDVAALVTAEADDALAIFGPGEAVHVEFDAALPPLPPNWTRRFVLETVGWCKDMDLMTRDGEHVEPVPASGAVDETRRRALHEAYNTRYQSGR